ncbi:lipase family protein [Anabaena sp. UHCC 0204]|uniref:lipase family protein n=1 Tax=Anabaena sp. UHCC 0204 TaxID=2590009 RepID=UPI0014468D89|nr:lipase family protein [Anabaena sp. UHCC 0204]MTJ10882.1 lipase family protein [Anabaena sp. UHCC 0204]
MKVDYVKAFKCAVSCQEIYQDFSKLTFSDCNDQQILISKDSTDTQTAILTKSSGITIVFRGSNSYFDWKTNFDTKQKQKEFDQTIIHPEIIDQNEKVYPYNNKNSSGVLMHRGFVNAYFSVREQIHKYIKDQNITNVTVTGHSLGGALATLCAVDIQYNFANQLSSIEAYLFGAPKVGNKSFRESYNQRVPNTYRFIYGMDLIPELPRWWQGYEPVDQELRIGSRFSWNFISSRFNNHAIIKYIDFLKEASISSRS